MATSSTTDPVTRSKIQHPLASLLEGKHSDFTIKCGERSFKVHKLIVCAQSKPLAVAMVGPFKEATIGEVILQDDDPQDVGDMIKYMYTQGYDDSRQAQKSPGSKTSPGPDRFIVNVKMYIIADRYDLQHLKAAATQKYQRLIRFSYNSRCSSLNWSCASFCASLEKLYQETTDSDRLMKDAIVRIIGKSMLDLMGEATFRKLCKKIPEISFDALSAMRAHYMQDVFKLYRLQPCKGCNRTDGLSMFEADKEEDCEEPLTHNFNCDNCDEDV